MAIYRKIEREGAQAIYEELEVVPSDEIILIGAAYNYLMGSCVSMTPEIAMEIITLIALEDVPSIIYGTVEGDKE